MKTKLTILFLFVISLITLGVAYFILEIYECGHSSFCNFLNFQIARPLFYGAGALAIVFLALFFVPNAFNVWKKFAIWAIPIGLFLFLVTPQHNSGGIGGGVGFGPTALETYRWVSALYVVISLALIGWTIVRSKNMKSVS